MKDIFLSQLICAENLIQLISKLKQCVAFAEGEKQSEIPYQHNSEHRAKSPNGRHTDF